MNASAAIPSEDARNDAVTVEGAKSGEQPCYELRHDPADELRNGTTIAGKYRVCGVLGRGGFATVYDAEHLDLRRHVALKVLHRTNDTPEVLIERFAREVRISALVRHPHVLEVFDAGALPDGSPFLVMEKIEGRTLHDHLTDVKRLSIDETLQLATQLLSALVALSERGIVHRDIKPENVMLVRSELGGFRLKLLDFGIALVRNERIERRLTMRGALIGTPHYMAPEQLRSEVVDARVDLYACGVVLYQALTGSMPFDGNDLASLTLNVLNGQAPSLRELRRDCPNGLVRIIERALSRTPERRYQDAASMLSDVVDCGSPSGLRSIAQFPQLCAQRASESFIQPVVGGRMRKVAVAAAALIGWLVWSELPERDLESTQTATAQVAHAEAAPAAVNEPSALTSGVAPEPALAPKPVATALLPTVEAEPAPTAARATAHVAAAPQPRPADPQKAAALSSKALALYLHGDLATAYSTYRRAAQANPEEASAYRGMGLSASRLGKTREARRAYARYLELAPKALDAELIRARMKELM